MCWAMFCDRRSVIPTPAFSWTVSSSSAVTPCNRAGTMDTTLGFTVSNTCGGLLCRRRKKERFAQKTSARTRDLGSLPKIPLEGGALLRPKELDLKEQL